MDIQVKIAIGLMILIAVIGIGSATYQECREIMCDGHIASKELKGKDTDRYLTINCVKCGKVLKNVKNENYNGQDNNSDFWFGYWIGSSRYR